MSADISGRAACSTANSRWCSGRRVAPGVRVAPWLADDLATASVRALNPSAPAARLALWHGLNLALLLSAVTLFTTLRIAVGICLNSRFPMFVWWGRELVNIYNDAYIPILGKRHAHAFGRPAREIWGEIWPVVGPQAEAVMQRRLARRPSAGQRSRSSVAWALSL